uniref:non-specific serine/threonine protein kinase n=1 Tax=Aegilops tauschii subsp. strangulata TaxID=200361 RepID=A0A452XJX3_AEGTS
EHIIASCSSIVYIYILFFLLRIAEQSTFTLFPMPLLYILVLALLLSHTPRCSSSAPAGDTLTEGQVLAVGDKLVSTNGKFALGFFQPATTTINQPFTLTSSLRGRINCLHNRHESYVWVGPWSNEHRMVP